LQLLNQNQVKYLLVGGYAVMKYTEPFYTKDIDVWVEATPENAKRTFQAWFNSALRWRILRFRI